MREGSKLTAQLDAYEATSASSDRSAGKKQQKHWRVYAAAAGSSLALATSAGADIIYSGPENISAGFNPEGNRSLVTPFTINGVHLSLFVTHHKTGTTTARGTRRAGLIGGGNFALLNASGQLKRLASGTKISGGAGISAEDRPISFSPTFRGEESTRVLGQRPKRASRGSSFRRRAAATIMAGSGSSGATADTISRSGRLAGRTTRSPANRSTPARSNLSSPPRRSRARSRCACWRPAQPECSPGESRGGCARGRLPCRRPTARKP